MLAARAARQPVPGMREPLDGVSVHINRVPISASTTIGTIGAHVLVLTTPGRGTNLNLELWRGPGERLGHADEVKKPCELQGFSKKRLKGLEPSTFCMASRRSSQLSYSRMVSAE